MKKYLITTTLLCVASLGANAATIHTDLVNYWTLDGNGNDTAGDFTEGTSTLDDNVVVGGTAGAATIVSSGGLFGGAGDFEREIGTDGRLQAADSADVNFTDRNLTTSLWVQFEDNSVRWQGILAKGEGADYRISAFNSTDNAGYAGGLGDIDSGVNVRDTLWHHIVTTTTEGGPTQIFVDGVLTATNNGTASIVDDGNQNGGLLFIGNNPDNALNSANRQWDGLIDDVAQWERVLTADEVAEIFEAGQAGISLGEIGAIPEPSSTLLLGLSGLAVAFRRRR